MVGLVVLAATSSSARADTWLLPPIDGAVTRPFEAPESRWGPGHRGIDLAASAGAMVRAAGAGTVTFAGSVAGTLAITIDHGGGLESTYSRLSESYVTLGQSVEPGTWIGVVGDAHAGVPGLHLGVKLHGEYVDPATLIGPLDLSAAIHLAPVEVPLSEVVPDFFGEFPDSAGSHVRSCRPASEQPPATPPNGNVVVAVAGIGSRTSPEVDATMYEPGPRALGYPAPRVYNFSYRGVDGPRFHDPYGRSDTFGDLRVAAGKLRELLALIHDRHPDAAVDLIAHSQGGIVARTYLQEAAAAWAPRLPRVEHVVTFSTPHGGAAVAGARRDVEASLSGKLALAAASYWSERGGPIPDPDAAAVAQLAPGSVLLQDLAREDVLFGTRALSLAIPNDMIVTADRALWSGAASAVVPMAGLNGHDAIVDSDTALAIAHGFLRDGPPLCRDSRDTWGPLVGRAIGWAETSLARLLP